MKLIFSLLLLTSTLFGELYAQENPRLIKDLVTGTSSSFPGGLLTTDDYLVFTAQNGKVDDWEFGGDSPSLMYYDGLSVVTPTEHQAIRTANSLSPIYYHQGQMGFISENLVLHNNSGLLSTDISTGEIKTVKEGVLARSALVHFNSTNLGGTVLFIGDDPVTGQELWITDGSEENTFMLADIVPGAGGIRDFGGAELFKVFDSLAFINLSSAGSIWVTTGSQASTKELINFSDMPELSAYDDLLYYHYHNGQLYLRFTQGQGNANALLMLVEVSSGEIVFTKEIDSPDIASQQHLEVNRWWVQEDLLYFESLDDLWVTDGTPEGTLLLYQASDKLNYVGFTNNGVVITERITSSEQRLVLVNSQGAAEIISDFNSTSNSAPDFHSYVQLDNEFLFVMETDEHGYELWTTDGSTGGTQILTELEGGANSSNRIGLIQFDDKVFFKGNANGKGVELFEYDPSTKQVQVFDINLKKAGVDAHATGLINQSLYFLSNTVTDDPLQLRYTNGDLLVADLDLDEVTSILTNTQINSVIEYGQDLIASFLNLYVKVDPQSFDLSNLGNDFSFGFGVDMITFDEDLYIIEQNSIGHTQLLRTKGVEGTTEMVFDFGKRFSGPGDQYDYVYTEDNMFMQMPVFSNSLELWVTDGENSTNLIDLGGRELRYLIQGDNEVFAVLWKAGDRGLYSVTTDGIIKILDGDFNICTTCATIIDDELVVVDTKRIYSIKEDKIDTVVTDISQNDTKINKIIASDGDKAYLITYDLSESTFELYRYRNDTMESIFESPTGFIEDFKLAESSHGSLLFVANSIDAGSELWYSGGTAETTFMVADINAGSASSNPSEFVMDKNTLIFVAESAETGREFWEYDLPRPYLSIEDDQNSLEAGEIVNIGSAPLNGTFTKSFSVKNIGLEPMLVNDLSISNTTPEIIDVSFSSPSGSSIEAGQMIDLNLDIVGLTEGAFSAEVVITSTAPNGQNFTFTITGEVVAKEVQSIEIASIGAKSFGDPSFTLAVTGASSLGTPSFSTSDPSILEITGSTATIINAGEVVITATQPGDDNFLEATASIGLTIAKADQSISFNAPSQGQIGESLVLNATSTSGLPVSFSLDGESAALTGNELTFLSEGSITVSAMQEGNNNYEAATTINAEIQVVETITAIDELPDLKIYPNPADQELRIELPNHSIASIRMIDLSGKIWHERNTQSSTLTIDVKLLPSGIYVLQLQTITGEQTTRKVLIQR